jgi:hypothetical protein
VAIPKFAVGFAATTPSPVDPENARTFVDDPFTFTDNIIPLLDVVELIRVLAFDTPITRLGELIIVGSAVGVKFKPGFIFENPDVGVCIVKGKVSLLNIAVNLLLTNTLPTMCDCDDESTNVFATVPVIAVPGGTAGPTAIHTLPLYTLRMLVDVFHQKSPVTGFTGAVLPV